MVGPSPTGSRKRPSPPMEIFGWLRKKEFCMGRRPDREAAEENEPVHRKAGGGRKKDDVKRLIKGALGGFGAGVALVTTSTADTLVGRDFPFSPACAWCSSSGSLGHSSGRGGSCWSVCAKGRPGPGATARSTGRRYAEAERCAFGPDGFLLQLPHRRVHARLHRPGGGARRTRAVLLPGQDGPRGPPRGFGRHSILVRKSRVAPGVKATGILWPRSDEQRGSQHEAEV